MFNCACASNMFVQEWIEILKSSNINLSNSYPFCLLQKPNSRNFLSLYYRYLAFFQQDLPSKNFFGIHCKFPSSLRTSFSCVIKLTTFSNFKNIQPFQKFSKKILIMKTPIFQKLVATSTKFNLELWVDLNKVNLFDPATTLFIWISSCLPITSHSSMTENNLNITGRLPENSHYWLP